METEPETSCLFLINSQAPILVILNLVVGNTEQI